MDLGKYAIIDLHLHLDGSLSAKAIIECAKEENIELPTYDENELNKYLRVDSSCSSLTDYLTKFDIPNRVLQSANGLRKCTLDLLERLSEDGLKYVEIRMAPSLSTIKGLSQEEVVKVLIKTLKEGEEKYKIKSNLILCMMRHSDKKTNFETIEITKKYLGKGVVAIDLAGDEKNFPNENLFYLFERINELKLPFTIHVGESMGHKSIDNILKYHPNRIGHGVRSIESKETLSKIKEQGIYLEVCPTSNVDTKAFKRIEDVPVKKLLEEGIKVTINTDDMTVSNITLKEEYNNLVKMGLTEKDIYQISLNAIEASFLSKEEKVHLINLIS